MIRSLFVSCALGAALLAASAQAASVSIVQTQGSSAVATGDVVAFDVVLSFPTVPTLVGGFDIQWDPDALELVSLETNSVGDPSFGRDPDILEGLLEAWGFGDFAGISGTHVLGTIEFAVLPTMGASTSIDFGCSGLQSCQFVSADDFVTLIPTDLIGAQLTRVPVPAPALLLVCALTALTGVARR